MTKRTADASPRFKARIAGVFYLLTFVTGVFALVSANGRLIAGLLATASYIAVTLLFYDLFKPVSGGLSLLAAFFGLTACAIAGLNPFHLIPFELNSLVFLGVYCRLM